MSLLSFSSKTTTAEEEAFSLAEAFAKTIVAGGRVLVTTFNESSSFSTFRCAFLAGLANITVVGDEGGGGGGGPGNTMPMGRVKGIFLE